MKKLINDPRQVVREMLEGLVDLSPELALLGEENVVVRRNLPPPADRKVALISGGGSGHEPAHAGYVGEGMLSAAVCGDVFTSPSVDAILAAIKAVSGPGGALLIVKNYTGDRLNFGLAAELAQQEGIPTEIVVVGDDVALKNLVAKDRRRGIAGTVLIHKIAGAAAANGRSLAEVVAVARRAVAGLGTMGIGLGSCTVPAAGVPGFSLGSDEVEFGLGIHGEKGVERTTIKSADEIVDVMVGTIVDELAVAPGTSLGLLVNGLGGTTGMELSIVARRALATLRGRGFKIGRAWAGNYMTALEMPGCSISLLAVDDEMDALLGAPTSAPAWRWDGRISSARAIATVAAEETIVAQDSAGPLSERTGIISLAVAAALEQAEAQLADLDSRAGDGDLGASMVRGATALRSLSQTPFATPSAYLAALGNALRRSIAGSSGPFYATSLLRASSQLKDRAVPVDAEWHTAFTAAVAAISELGGAKPGDRTMLDALHPAADAWKAAIAGGACAADALAAAAAAAEEGARNTAGMTPMLGRASYLGARALGVPDGGAVAVSIWLRALADSLPR